MLLAPRQQVLIEEANSQVLEEARRHAATRKAAHDAERLAEQQATSMLESAEARRCAQLCAVLSLAARRQVRADARAALLRWQQLARQRQLAGEHAALREELHASALALENVSAKLEKSHAEIELAVQARVGEVQAVNSKMRSCTAELEQRLEHALDQWGEGRAQLEEHTQLLYGQRQVQPEVLQSMSHGDSSTANFLKRLSASSYSQVFIDVGMVHRRQRRQRRRQLGWNESAHRLG
eukprot:SAG11_NODE_4136_length_2044_cov_1.715681_2_plen_238_part_00